MNAVNFLEQLKSAFRIDGLQMRKQLIQFQSSAADLDRHLMWLHRSAGFETLTMITCADWIEDGVYHLNYIMQANEAQLTVMVGLDLPRDSASLPSYSKVWPQSETYERELHEMYGIEIVGHPEMREFFLEDWHYAPPMRRDFDTLAFVEEHYVMRTGREDALDVKEVLKQKIAAKKSAEGESL